MASKNNLLALKLPVFAEAKSRIPFIGLALITAALKDAGYSVWQKDLNAISRRKGYYSRTLKPHIKNIFTFTRTLNFVTDKEDIEIEHICLRLLSLGRVKTKLTKTDCVLLSVGLYDNHSSMMALCLGKLLKKHFSVKVIIGGERYPNYEPILEMFNKLTGTNAFDYYIRSYGEKPLLKLLAANFSQKKARFIPGIYYFTSHQKVIRTPPTEEHQVRIPDYKGLLDTWHTWKPPPKVAKILNVKKQAGVKVIPVKLIHGCPNKCAFCRASVQDKRCINLIDPEKLVKNIKRLKKTFGARYFFFADDLFNVSEKFVTDVCDQLIKQKANILWSDCAQFRGWTKELLKKAKDSGAIRLIYGLESASPRMQKYINKHVDLDHAEKVLRWSHELGIFNGLEIIAGLPTETDEDIQETVDFIERNKEYLDEVTLNSFYLLRGSLFYTQASYYGIKNIKQIESVKGKKEKKYHSLHTFNFDEANGLRWPEKRKQIVNSTQTIRNCLIRNHLQEGNQDRLHVLFSLYNHWQTKPKVRKHYLAWKKATQEVIQPLPKRNLKSQALDIAFTLKQKFLSRTKSTKN